MTEYLDNVLMRVTKEIDHGLALEQKEAKIKNILATKDEEQNPIFDLIQQNAERYPLLVGFCYNLGMGTVKDEKKAFKNWEKDTTSYGHYLVGMCYTYGWGVDIDYDRAFLEFKLSADTGNSSGQ